MTATLWERLDEALIDAFTAEMGVPGDYDPETDTPDPLWVEAFETGDTWNPDKGPFPALLLLSDSADIDPGQHGAPVGAVELSYPYMVVAVAELTTYAAARSAAQTMGFRIRQTLSKWPAILAAAHVSGTQETPQVLMLRRARIEVRGRQGSNRGRYLGIAVVQFSVDATERGDD